MQNSHQLIQSIYLANNQAASLLEHGHFEEAIVSFSKSLKVYHQFVHDSNPKTTRKPNLDQYMIPSQFQQAYSQSSSSLDQQQEASIFIYQRAIFIPLSTKLLSSESNTLLLSVVIPFNLALCHHLSAMKSCSTSKLRKAAQLYELAYNLASDLGMENLVFSIATINNLGNISYLFGKTETATRLFSGLLSVLMYLVVRGNEEHDNSLGASDLEGFFRNTSHLILQDQTAAAA
jgi:tetratricopeptide (TPR) repeat protein